MSAFGERTHQVLSALRHCVGEDGPAPWICPACGDAAFHRSRPVSWVEQVGRVAGVRVYRCHTCHHRRWQLHVASCAELPKRTILREQGRASRTLPVRQLALVTVLAAALAGVVWQVSSHRLAIRAKGEQALALGRAWWLGAHSRVSVMASNLRLRQPPPAETPAVTAPSAVPPKRQPARSNSRTSAVAGGAEAVGGVAWRAARWGMTVEDVLEAFPAEAVRVPVNGPVASKRLSVRAALEHAAIGTHTYDVSFFFRGDGRLTAIKISPDTREQSATHAYLELADLLSKEIGPPAHRDTRSPQPAASSDVTSWKTAESSITLRLDDPPPNDARILTIDIRSGEISAVPRGVVLWYEPVDPLPAPTRRAVARAAR